MFVLNPFGVLTGLLCGVAIYLFLDQKSFGSNTQENKKIQNHSSILLGLLVLFFYSGVQGGWNFFPTAIGLGLLCYKKFSFIQAIAKILPQWLQIWNYAAEQNQNYQEEIVNQQEEIVIDV
jgi:hypothetical protein